MAEPIVVWRFTDGKAGHENQTAGLLAALRDCVSIDDYQLQTASCRSSLAAFVTRRIPFGQDLPDPDLIIGAGHATHLPMLAARRARGGRAIVLMKPSLPGTWFDLCIIPAHDNPRVADNILVTQGVLNRLQPSTSKDASTGLLLIGGPSAHVNWSDEAVLAQLRTVLEQDEVIHWTLTTSRRTPDSFLQKLGALPQQHLNVVPVTDAGPDWLVEQLAGAGCAWVSADSVSMVYEALTAGAAVGLLDVPYRSSNDRLAQGMKQLVAQGLVTTYADWRKGKTLQSPSIPFDEAARCADWIHKQWLTDR
ncbi:MAG: mitochondrial fission ELM1 family protein [Gammaproteobacteria bacterium]|nr:mitochondrial fission ELM1 family protein [Gammaproteobacteria bacterium]